jgi:hypothetical protein
MSQGNLNFLQHFKRQGIDPSHLYKAKIVDNDDPLKIGRVKARISIMMDDIKDEFLPWAAPRFQHPQGAFPGCSGTGYFSVPKVGSYVFLKFQSQDPNTPFYESYTVDNETRIDYVTEDYPNTHVLYRFDDCSVLLINTKTHELYIYNAGKLKVRVDGDAKVSIKGNTDLHISGDNVNDIYGDTVFNIKASDLRSYEQCDCSKKDNMTYPAAGYGELTVNVDDNTVLNNVKTTTLNTKKSVYINTDETLNVNTTQDCFITTTANLHVNTEKETKIYSKGKLHIKTDDELLLECKKFSVTTDSFLLKSEDVDIATNKIVMKNKEKIEIQTDKLHIKSEKETVMDNVQLDGVISRALAVTKQDINKPDVNDPKDPTKPEKAEKGKKGDKSKGGKYGWFVKLAQIVGLKKVEKQNIPCA